MIRLCQRDKKWGNILIGKSKVSTISSNGCLITSLCMLQSKFHPRTPIFPDYAAKTWDFVAVPGDSDPRYVNWSGHFDGMMFVKRVNEYIPELHDQAIQIYSQAPDMGVCLQVQTKSGSQHWLVCIGKSTLGWSCNDPWDGKRLYKTVGFGAPYKRITGYVVMRKV